MAGKYRLLEQLGEGGMGSVWRAEHLLLRSHVAIKLINPELATTPAALSRFLREAQAAASLRSPHVVQILDYGVDEGTPYIAMELLDGESLATRLSRVARLDPAETATLFVQIGRAVARAHDAGIVHRDLKPDNVFIIRNDEDEVAKVLDFGIAKLNSRGIEAPATGATRTGALLGTPYYMSPEQMEGSRALDHRSDIWAIGVIAFECLLGRRPFDGETIGGLVLAICSKPLPVPSTIGVVPFGFDEWFARACSRELEARFAFARDATRELKQLCEGSVVSASSNLRGSGAELVATEEPEAVRQVYPAAPQSPPSLVAFTSSQTKPDTGFTPRRAGLLVGAALILAGGTLLWLRARAAASEQTTTTAVLSSARLQPASSVVLTPVPTVPSPNAESTASAHRIVSLESIPTAEPVASTRPAPGKPRSAPSVASTGVVPLTVDLDTDAHGAAADTSPLPENPYKAAAKKITSSPTQVNAPRL